MRILRIFCYLQMLPGPEPSLHVQQSECLHPRLLALQNAVRTLQPCTLTYLGAVHMPLLRNKSVMWCVGNEIPPIVIASFKRAGFLNALSQTSWHSQYCSLYRTFLGNTDGATTHSHPQGIHTSIYEIFSLSSCHHQRETDTQKRAQCVRDIVRGYKGLSQHKCRRKH